MIRVTLGGDELAGFGGDGPDRRIKMFFPVPGLSLGLNRKQVSSVLDGLTALVASQIGKKGSGIIAIPGLLKIMRIHKPATKAKKGVPNPFKPGELMDVPAKPARRQVKVQALKALKDVAK